MKRIVANTNSWETGDKKEGGPPLDVPAAEISLDDLLDKTRLILYREIRNLLIESTPGLLSKDSSQALVSYIKLLKDLKKAEEETAEDLTDEELEQLVQKSK